MMQVVCALLKKDDRLFLARRSPQMKHAGKWEFPGGKLQQGESFIAAIKRELQEELKVEIEVKQMLPGLHWPPDRPEFELLPLLGEISRGSIDLQEHDAGIWCREEELYDLDILPADLLILQRSKEQIWS